MSDHIQTKHLLPAFPLPVSKLTKTEVLPRTEVSEIGPAPPPQADPVKDRHALEEATQQLNEQMQRNSRDLRFTVDDMTNTVVVTVKNRTGEVVRQIPNEVALRVAHNLANMKGLLQDGKS